MRQAIVRFTVHGVGQQKVFNDEDKLASFIAALVSNQCSFSVEFF